ncbi:hypothetical protein N9W31_00610 [Litoricolaceae bacterium]|nr:hypothetical protein [Litorivicinaceae bacterium]
MRIKNARITILSRTRQKIDSLPSCYNFIFDPERRADLSSYTHAIIASQTCSHLEDFKQCVGSIFSIYLEKPAYVSAELIEPVIDEFIDRGGVFHHGFMTRHHPIINYATSWLELQNSQVISAYFSIGRKLSDWRPLQSNDAFVSYSYDRARGGIVFFDLIHELDLLMAFFGPVVEAFGFSAELEEKGCVRIASGDAVCIHHNSVVSAVHLDSVDPVGHRKIRFLGNNLYFEANLLSGEVKQLVEGRLETRVFESDRNKMFVDAMKQFILMSELRGEERRQVAIRNKGIALASLRLAEQLSWQSRVGLSSESI